MNVLAFVLAPVAVAVVLFVSGWAKVGDVTGTRLAFVAMKVPAALTRPSVVRALPFAELLLGCALLLTWGWVLAVAAAATTLLFLVYAALVARVLRAGDDVECHCFGTLGDDRVTSVTLARNLVLVLLAALATGFGASGSGVVPAIGDFQGSDWWWPVMTALVVLTALLIFRPGGAADEPTVDDEEMEDYLRQPVPIGFLESEDGRRVQLRDLATRQPQLLIFMSIGCGACHIVAEWLPSFARAAGDRGRQHGLHRAAGVGAGEPETGSHHVVRPAERGLRPLRQRQAGGGAVRRRRHARRRAGGRRHGHRGLRRRHRRRARLRATAGAPGRSTRSSTTTTTITWTTTTVRTTTDTGHGHERPRTPGPEPEPEPEEHAHDQVDQRNP